MSGKWKTRRRRREEEGGSYVVGLLKGAIAGGAFLGISAVALLSLLPPAEDPILSAEDAAAATQDASAREERGRSGPTSTGNFAAGDAAIDSPVVAPNRAPSVASPGGVPAVAVAPSAAPSTSPGISGIGSVPTTTGAPGAPRQIGGAGLAPAPVAPSPFGVPTAPPLGQVDPTSLSREEARAALAALEAAESAAEGGATGAPVAEVATVTPLPTEEPAATETTFAGTPSETDLAPKAAETSAVATLAPGQQEAPISEPQGSETIAEAPVSEAPTVPESGEGGLTFTLSPSTEAQSGTGSEPLGLEADAEAPPQISAEVTPSVVPPAEAAPTDLAPSEAAEEAVALATVPPTTSPPPRRRPGLELDLDLEGDAFVQNAVSADVAAEMPIVAVILLVAEDGAAIPSDTLQMQVPIGLAVAPVREDVETLAETARSAGHEVLAAIAPGDRRVASLAGGDIDPTLAALARLPQAIGAMALPGLGTPGRPEDLFEMLAEHGFAYVDPRPLGGGATVRAAAAQGIPSAAISNQAAGQDRASVYRAMQVAAGVARRQGTAILAAAATPEAFAAVAKWQSERGGGRVAIAPVSEVIRRRAR